jgi:hypothetical protein
MQKSFLPCIKTLRTKSLKLEPWKVTFFRYCFYTLNPSFSCFSLLFVFLDEPDKVPLMKEVNYDFSQMRDLVSYSFVLGCFAHSLFSSRIRSSKWMSVRIIQKKQRSATNWKNHWRLLNYNSCIISLLSRLSCSCSYSVLLQQINLFTKRK